MQCEGATALQAQGITDTWGCEKVGRLGRYREEPEVVKACMDSGHRRVCAWGRGGVAFSNRCINSAFASPPGEVGVVSADLGALSENAPKDASPVAQQIHFHKW